MSGAGGGAAGKGGEAAAGRGSAGSGASAGHGGSGSSSGGAGGNGGSTTGAGGAGDGMTGAVRSAGCGKTRTLMDGKRTITSGGASRSYILKTPTNYNNMDAHRLIFAFHWRGGSANSVANPPDADHNTDRPYYGLPDVSGDSAIYVAPDAVNGGWNDSGGADVTFTEDMLKAISDDLCIDTSRVFTTGFSWGAAMSWKLACMAPDKFRAALVYEVGSVSGNNASQCTKPIAWFQSHGVDDGTFSYSSGLDVLKIFAKNNGCTFTMPTNPATNAHACVTLTGCTAAYPTRFCAFGSGENNPYNTGLRGHYPSPKDPGETVTWVTAEAWKFIMQF